MLNQADNGNSQRRESGVILKLHLGGEAPIKKRLTTDLRAK